MKVWMKWRRVASVLVLAMASVTVVPGAAVLSAQASSIEGRWLTGKRGVAVTLYRCGSEMCGRIDWLAKPRYRGGELKIDRENPNPALRERPWCGIDVVFGLKETKPGVWTDGEVYNPKDGNRYDLEIKDRGETLRVRAFLGVKLLGQKEVWIKAPEDTPGCTETG